MGKKTAVGSVVTFLVIVWFGWAFAGWLLPSHVTLTERGVWGDSFGGLNAFLSSLAFVAVLMTIVMQQSQIKSQQEQLEAGQRDQHRQRFDESFFRLLSLLRDVRGELSYKRTTVLKAREASGPQALRGAANDAVHHLIDRSASLGRDLTKTEVANIYSSNVHKSSEAGLGPYFRLIYTILRRIDSDPLLSEGEKIAYGNLLRGQLGSPEIALLALNGLTKESKDLSRYVNHFRMLRYLGDRRLRKFVEPWYDRAAFEARND